MRPETRPPGPSNGFFGLGNVKAIRDCPLEFVAKMGREFGDIAYFRLGPHHAYLLNHPDLIRDVLVTNSGGYRKLPQQTAVMQQIEGNGMLVSDGSHWRRARELMQPAFRQRCMSHYAETIVEFTERMMESWSDGQEIDIAEEMGRLSLLIMSRTLLGVDLSDRYEEVRRMVYDLSSAMMRDMKAAVRLDWLPTPANRKKRKAIKDFDDLLWSIIKQKRDDPSDAPDLLSILLSAEQDSSSGISERDVRDEVATVFNAGHDTAAAALTWNWLAIAQNAEVEARLVSEIDALGPEALGRGRPILEGLKQLPYAEMVVKETMRLYPPGWTLFTRQSITKTQLGGYDIPRGSWLFLFPYVTHRDARFFPSPMQFDPLRFSPERVAEIAPCAYYPFGAGPHSCIGAAFSNMEMTLVTALVLRRFRFELGPNGGDVEEEALLNLWPKGGLRMIARERADSDDSPHTAESSTLGRNAY